MNNPDAEQFRVAYGRLMILAARAIHDGHDPARVAAAARGRAENKGPTLSELSRQRTRLNRAIMECKRCGVDRATFVQLAREAKRVAEAEWCVSIPMVED